MRKLELDDQGKVSLGPVGGAKTAAINVAFPSNDTVGLALSVEATKASPGDDNIKALIKLGEYTLGQDALGMEDGTFGIVGANNEALMNLTLTKAILTWSVAYNAEVHWHQYPDTSVSGLATVAAVQADCNARANAFKAAAIAHAASVGGWNASTGWHWHADTTAIATLAAVPAATDLATSITLCTALHTWLVAHMIEANVHFYNDATTVTTVSDSTPADLAAVALFLNEFASVIQAHFTNGYPTVV